MIYSSVDGSDRDGSYSGGGDDGSGSGGNIYHRHGYRRLWLFKDVSDPNHVTGATSHHSYEL